MVDLFCCVQIVVCFVCCVQHCGDGDGEADGLMLGEIDIETDGLSLGDIEGDADALTEGEALGLILGD